MKDSTVQYFDLFYETKGDNISDSEAFRLTEDKWEELHGFGKYTSFQSFRVMKSRYVRFIQRRANEARNKQNVNKVNAYIR